MGRRREERKGGRGKKYWNTHSKRERGRTITRDSNVRNGKISFRCFLSKTVSTGVGHPPIEALSRRVQTRPKTANDPRIAKTRADGGGGGGVGVDKIKRG